MKFTLNVGDDLYLQHPDLISAAILILVGIVLSVVVKHIDGRWHTYASVMWVFFFVQHVCIAWRQAVVKPQPMLTDLLSIEKNLIQLLMKIQHFSSKKSWKCTWRWRRLRQVGRFVKG